MVIYCAHLLLGLVGCQSCGFTKRNRVRQFSLKLVIILCWLKHKAQVYYLWHYLRVDLNHHQHRFLCDSLSQMRAVRLLQRASLVVG